MCYASIYRVSCDGNYYDANKALAKARLLEGQFTFIVPATVITIVK
jgi:hypothetical protein